MNIEKIIKEALAAGRSALNEAESKRLLAEYGVPVVRETAARTADEAVKAARDFGFPVVLKGLGAALLHKSDQGLVQLNLADVAAVRKAAQAISASAGDRLEGYLVQPQVSGRREFMAGLIRDPQFGPVVLFGLGGIAAEALSDVCFRVAPLTEADAADMLTELKSAALLGPFRGEAAADRDVLIRTLAGLSRLGMDHPDIAEIDINPLIISGNGSVRAADALVVLKKKPAETHLRAPAPPERLLELFNPRSVAFVGASGTLRKWGHILPTHALSSGFDGKIFLVNPKGGTIAGREAYKSVMDIPEKVDLAVVTIPAAGVTDLLDQLREKGIANMVLVTSGFSETGEEGRILEKSLAEKAAAAGMLIIGPNTMGMCNPHIRFFCTGSHVRPRAGSAAVAAQSGNMGTQLLAFAEQQGVGVRAFAGSGNEAMVTIEDYLEAFGADPQTRTIVLYVESVKNGRRFFELAGRISRKKPVVLMSGGRTDAGHRAAASHTGAIASDARVFDAVCKQAGIIKVDYPMDLLDLSAAFSALPTPKGNRVGVMTLGGGWGVVTTDLCAERGLEVPSLPDDIVARIDKILPPYWSRSNPVDIVGEGDTRIMTQALDALMTWDGCDAVINLGILGRADLVRRYVASAKKADPSYAPEYLDGLFEGLKQFEQQYMQYIVQLMEARQKPVFCVSLFSRESDQAVFRVEGSRFKCVLYPTPERAVRALAKMHEYQRFLDRT